MKVSTWANGFGLWRARVTGVSDFDAAHRAARAAISREIRARGGQGVEDYIAALPLVLQANERGEYVFAEQ